VADFFFPRFSHAGRLQRYSGRAPRTFPGVWDDKQDHHSLRQVYRASERVSTKLYHPSRFVPHAQVVCRFAYVEFAEPDFVDAAMALDNSLFRGRLIKVRVCLTFPVACPQPCGPQGYGETDEYSWIQQRSRSRGLQGWLPRWLPRWGRLSTIPRSRKVRSSV